MAMQPNPKKAVLSDLYQRKPARTYPGVTNSNLRANSRHRRLDMYPSLEDGDRTDYRCVYGDLVGQGMWVRYNGNNKPWKHTKISQQDHAMGIVRLVKDGRIPGDDMLVRPFMKIGYMTAAERGKQNDLLKAAVYKIENRHDGECWHIDYCSHDVYTSIPVGRDNKHVFSPGLNQLWVIMDSGRHEILAHVVVAAKAEDEAVAYFAGCPRANVNEAFHSVMTFQFNSFSTADNPLDYLVQASSSTGFATLTLEVAYVGKGHGTGGVQYVTVLWTLEVGGIPGWLDEGPGPRNRPFEFWWASLEKMNEFNYFMTKGLQIYEICHCYHMTTHQLQVCLLDGLGKTFAEKLALKMMLDTYKQRKDVPENWDIRPKAWPFWFHTWILCYDNFHR